jgi:rare lipoprotein A
MKRIVLLAVMASITGCTGSLVATEADPNTRVEEGLASYYADAYHGRQTASGEIYDMHARTAAHPTLPFNTWVRVTNLDNQRSVDLRINDRGPFVPGRILDVSLRGAQDLDFVAAGLAPVRVEVLTGKTTPGDLPQPPGGRPGW